MLLSAGLLHLTQFLPAVSDSGLDDLSFVTGAPAEKSDVHWPLFGLVDRSRIIPISCNYPLSG
jgi:hypothetical protein